MHVIFNRGERTKQNMVSANEIRLNRIMRKGKMLCIPMDHGISNGPIEGLEDPASTIYKCEGHGLTSVIINKGILKSLPKPPKIGTLVHFSSRRRHTRCSGVSWARRCV